MSGVREQAGERLDNVSKQGGQDAGAFSTDRTVPRGRPGDSRPTVLVDDTVQAEGVNGRVRQYWGHCSVKTPSPLPAAGVLLPRVLIECRDDARVLSPDGQQRPSIATQYEQLVPCSAGKMVQFKDSVP